MKQEPILEVKNLTKKFASPTGEFTAVDNISFSVGKGEVVGLLGPNGAGKTTTIQMLLDVMEPTHGSITYFGKSFIKHREEILRDVNFTSGYIRLPWFLTIDEILDVFTRLYEVPNRKERMRKLLTIFEIEDFGKMQFGKLSEGQRTRVLLVKAFLNYPKVLLLDEPTVSLDPDIAKKVRTFLKKERDEFDVSMLFTSHNMAEVEEVCDRVMFINHGKIVAEGKPTEIARNIADCRLQLMVVKNRKEALSLINERGFPIREDGVYLTIKVPEEQVASLLTQLARENISYEEISIEKPDLEDFFLTMMKGGHNENI